MHVVTTRREYKGRVYEAHLLRRTYREGGKVKNETLELVGRLNAIVGDPRRAGIPAGDGAGAAEATPASETVKPS